MQANGESPDTSATMASPTSTIPLKRVHEDDHAPTISSPLNPDPKPRPIQREQREKKDSLKKREAAGLVNAPAPSKAKGGKKQISSPLTHLTEAPSPIRYNHPLPREYYHYTPKDTLLASHEPEPLLVSTDKGQVELKRPIDSAENKKIYRYNHCIADPSFKHIRYYRSTDDKPHGPRMSFTDSDRLFHFDDSGRIVTNDKGWRMSRANVCAREGQFYFEVKIHKGVPREGPPVQEGHTGGPLPHVRVGWSRREAPLDAPVGFDGYSYGVSDIRLEPMHKSRASKFLDNGVDVPGGKKKAQKAAKNKAANGAAATTTFAANDHAREGDVIGMLISLPSLSLHRKVAEGSYNPAVDIGNGFNSPATDDDGALNIVRDRFPVPYRGAMYFESMEYRASKGMESYGDRGPFSKETPGPNHDEPTLRSLPHSSIQIFKNGKMIGTAFRDLMAFLPPTSVADRGKDAKESYDDGMVGYFPTIAVFSGGVAEVNLGPDFWFPPAVSICTDTKPEVPATSNIKQEEDTVMTDGIRKEQAPPRTQKIRAMGERYVEQIAEDILYDIIDEADFYVQDNGADEIPP